MSKRTDTNVEAYAKEDDQTHGEWVRKLRHVKSSRRNWSWLTPKDGESYTRTHGFSHQTREGPWYKGTRHAVRPKRLKNKGNSTFVPLTLTGYWLCARRLCSPRQGAQRWTEVLILKKFRLIEETRKLVAQMESTEKPMGTRRMRALMVWGWGQHRKTHCIRE